MHGSMMRCIALSLATAIVPGFCAAALAQDAATPQDNYYVSTAAPAEQSDLAARLADVEKALKKIDDKAKEDKKMAAGQMSATPGGRIHIDTAAFDQNSDDKLRTAPLLERNGVEFRTARLAIKGGGFNVIQYQIEWDFAGRDKARCKDTYMGITDLPILQNVWIGHFKEPYSLDELTSDNYTTFMERNVANDAIAPKRHIGVMAFGQTESQRATYAFGYFAEHNDDGGPVQDNVMGGAGTARVTWLPWYDEATEGRGLVHVGAAASHRQAYKDQYILKFRPESHLAIENIYPTMTGIDTRDLVGAELAFVYGPLSFQSEYYVNYINRITGDDCKAQGAYAYVSYFLTGEHRPYDRTRGIFGRVKPYENFFRVRDENGCVYTGKGAWELKYRYSWLDAYDHDLLGFDTVGDHTVGVNWYLNPYTRFMLEYIHSAINCNTGNGPGSLSIVQMRAQIDF